MKLLTSLLAAAAMSIASFVAPAFAQDKGVGGGGGAAPHHPPAGAGGRTQGEGVEGGGG